VTGFEFAHSGKSSPAQPVFDFSQFKLLDRRVWILAWSRLVATLGFSMVLPFMIVYLTRDRLMPIWAATLVMSVSGACGALAQGIAGSLCDRIGRMPLIVAANILRTVNLGALGFCVSVEAPVWILAILFVNNSLARAFIEPPSQAMVADLTPVDQRVSAFSLQRMFINIGFASGPALAALADGTIGYHQLFYLSVPISFVGLLIILPLRRAANRPTQEAAICKDHKKQNWLRALVEHRHDHGFMWYALSTFLFFLLQIQLFVTLPIFAAKHLGLPNAEVSRIFTVNGLIVVALQLPAAGLINRIGRMRALIIGCIGYAVSYSALGLAGNLTFLLLCVGAITLSEVMLAPSQHSLVTTLAPEGSIGAYAGIFGLAQVAGQSVGPALGGLAMEYLDGMGLWVTLGSFGFMAALGYSRSHTLSKLRTSA
jgi:MFS family permease